MDHLRTPVPRQGMPAVQVGCSRADCRGWHDAPRRGGKVFERFRQTHFTDSGCVFPIPHVSLPWCVRLEAQIISRCHRGTDGTTGYRRAYGRSRIPRRCVPWSEKVFYFEQSKRTVQVEAKRHEGFSSELKTNLRSLWLQRHTELFFREAFAEFQSSKRGFWRWCAVQQHQRSPMGTAT